VGQEQILELKAQGHSLRQVAAKLGVGYGTIRARLLGLRKGLQKFQSEFARFAATAHLFSLSISKRRTL